MKTRRWPIWLGSVGALLCAWFLATAAHAADEPIQVNQQVVPRVANIGSCGAVYSKEGSLAGLPPYTPWYAVPWYQMLTCDWSAKSVVLSPGGRYIGVIRGDNTLFIQGTYYAYTYTLPWLQHVDIGDSQAVAIGPHGMVANVNRCGALYIKRSLWGQWEQHLGCGAAKSVSLAPSASDGQMVVVVRPDNTLIAKRTFWGNWDQHVGVGDSRAAAAGPNGMIANINGCGALYVKRSYWGQWEQHLGCNEAKSVQLFPPSSNGMMVLRSDNTLILKTSYWAPWGQVSATGGSRGGAFADLNYPWANGGSE